MTPARGHWIGGRWSPGGGTELVSTDPASGEACWVGRAATASEVDLAIGAARQAAAPWAERSIDDRAERLQAFVAALTARRQELAETISVEIGKPRWESLTEVDAMIAKLPATIAALRERRSPRSESAAPGMATSYRPLGVLVVLGPFNFPAHLPNGHIVPALLAGNTVVFKPSELAPRVAEKTIEIWETAGVPPGVLNLVQGGRETGAALAAHPGHDGILFTGSYAAGRALARALAERPHLLLVLEMGGNNPLVVDEVADLEAAAYATVQSAFLTSGQRCTAARRLIVRVGTEGDRFIAELAAMVRRIRVGAFGDRPEPFMGPVVTASAAERVAEAWRRLVERGGRPVVALERSPRGPAFLSPGLVDVTEVAARDDEEIFGPLLQIVRVESFEAALEEASNTAYGLVAAILSDRRDRFEALRRRARAGLVYWNRPTTGASGKLPFGGLGRSGNHRPSGYFVIDAVTDAVATIECDVVRLPEPGARSPGLDV